MSGCGITVFQFGWWQYLSAGGKPVLLALGPSKALNFADLEECFITVNVLAGNEEGMTKSELLECLQVFNQITDKKRQLY